MVTNNIAPPGRQPLWRLCLALLGALAGAAVFVWLYGTAVLNPAWDEWILNGYDEWDVQQHYAGWLLFRNAHWAFPLGLADTIAIPDGTVITYTDSLPWVSIFFKLLRGVLPPTFQWFGLYTLLCFALQGAAGALLGARGMPRSGASALFALFSGGLFACLPTLWERAFRHVALASQWIFLFALYFYLEYRLRLRQSGRVGFPWQLPLLAFVSVGIHPYFLPPVMICALLTAVDCGRCTRRWGRAALQFAASLAAALFGGVLCGAVGGDSGLSRSGYGDYSMNLNAIFNPSSRGGYTWSRVFPPLSQQAAQYDGFNYLGLGVLALVAFALLWHGGRTLRAPRAAGGWWRRNGPAFGACVFLTLFALSNRVYWGNTLLFEVPLPGPLANLCGIFRSSGRMFYLVAACMVVYGLYALRDAAARLAKALGEARAARWLAPVFLALALGVQLWDLGPAAAQKRAMLAADVPINATVVNDPQTGQIGVGHTRLLAAGEVREDRLRLLAILAGKQGLATNLDVAVSGSHPGAAQSLADTAALLQSGQYDPQTVYVTTDGDVWESWQKIFAGDANLTFFVASSCYFMVPLG